MSGAMRVLAGLKRVVESETPYGGRTFSHEGLGVVWLELGARRRRERTEAGAEPRAVETMTARARVDPRLAEGLVLGFGGTDWTIVTVEADPKRAGRVLLGLERGR